MFKACIFDLDGTLSNTLTTISYFGNNALIKYNYPSIEKDKYRYMVGEGADTLVRRMMKTVGDENEENFIKVRDYYNSTYDKDFLYLTEVYDGIPELINELKKRNFKIGVISNKPHSTTIQVISTLFGDKIDLFYGARDGVPKKPNPASLIQLMKDFGVKPEETIYVGDTWTDMQTGNSAGAYTVGVLWGFRDRKELEENNAKIIIEKPFEIIDLID